MIGKHGREVGEDEPNGAHGRRKTEMRGRWCGDMAWRGIVWSLAHGVCQLPPPHHGDERGGDDMGDACSTYPCAMRHPQSRTKWVFLVAVHNCSTAHSCCAICVARAQHRGGDGRKELDQRGRHSLKCGVYGWEVRHNVQQLCAACLYPRSICRNGSGAFEGSD